MNGKSSYELPDLSCSMGAHLGIQFLEMEEGYVCLLYTSDAADE